MPRDLRRLTQVLTSPLLEPELSGEQIGRNRISVIRHLSEILNDSQIQVWLIEADDDLKKTRLAYWFPKPSPKDLKAYQGHLIIEPPQPSPKKELTSRPSQE